MSLHPPGFIEPCLPTGSRTAPTGPQWAYEIKHDGFRFICHRDGERVRVFSRTGHEWGAQLPAIAAEVFRRLRQTVEPRDHHHVAGIEFVEHVGSVSV
jgi:ATP-dependent DNA ligase